MSTLQAPCGWLPDGCGDCDTFDGLTPTEQAQIEDVAVDALWRATGRVYGECPITVIPCGDDCGMSCFGCGPTRAASGSFDWVNNRCGGCGCGIESQITLEGPVASVQSVTVDGMPLDPTAFRVDNHRWVVRTDGGFFPDPWNATVEVAYTKGVPVPAGGLWAAQVLACELAKLCADQACRLPRTATSVSRQGVTITLPDIATLVREGVTGIWEVDTWVTSIRNENRPQVRINSPDLPRPRRQTWPVSS